MENVIHKLTLDLTGPDMLPRIEVQQDNARSLIISLTQGGRPYWIAEGVTAVFSGRKPDGKPLFNACAIEKNRVRYDFTDQTTNVAGIVECEILLYSGDERILASPRFELAIDELIHKEGDVPESAPELSALTQMVAAGTAMIEDLRAALGELENVEEMLEQAQMAAQSATRSEEAAGRAAGTAQSASSQAQTSAQRAETAQSRAESAENQALSASQQCHKYAYEANDSAAAASEAAQDSAASAEQAGAALQQIGTVVGSSIESHNVGRYAHSDIREELQALADRVNAALNSDDVTLDQLSEIVAYIKSNKTLIDAITTSKVSVSDIVNNLTTNVANKPLSAAQGVVLKTLIDELRQTVGQGGGTGDGAVRSVNGKTGDVTLTATDVGAMSESGANAIIINLLDEAKKSGEFDGPPGDDYVLTDADRQEIAEIAAGLVDVPNVKPVAKTENMTQPVGVDAEGQLWSAPLTVNIPEGGGGTWELIGEITSDGAGNSGGIYVPIDFTQYKEIHVEAVDTIDGELMYRLKYSNNTEWYGGEILTNVKRAEIVMHSVHTFNVSGELKNIAGYASGYVGGSGIHINNSPRTSMLASDFKFICLDANGTVVPEGATLKVWGCK